MIKVQVSATEIPQEPRKLNGVTTLSKINFKTWSQIIRSDSKEKKRR